MECEQVELDLCRSGCGLWFDADELRQLFERAGAPVALLDLERRLAELPGSRGGPRRRCPRCRARLRPVAEDGRPDAVVLDRCPRGHGLWFDPGELERVLHGARPQGVDDAGRAAFERVREHLSRFRLESPSADPPAQEQP